MVIIRFRKFSPSFFYRCNNCITTFTRVAFCLSVSLCRTQCVHTFCMFKCCVIMCRTVVINKFNSRASSSIVLRLLSSMSIAIIAIFVLSVPKTSQPVRRASSVLLLPTRMPFCHHCTVLLCSAFSPHTSRNDSTICSTLQPLRILILMYALCSNCITRRNTFFFVRRWHHYS